MKVLLVDGSEIFRMGLRAALAGAPGSGELAVAGECGSGRQACEVSAALVPDVVVTDLHLPDQSGIALARDLRRSDPHARVLILAPLGPESVVHQAVAAGASGYALKGQSPEEIVGAIRDVGRGILVLPPGVSPLPPRTAESAEGSAAPPAIDRLSQRERQIFDLVVWGASNKQIAGRLGISVKTVETHRGHINGKLAVHTSADIVRLASLWGLLFVPGPPSGPVDSAGVRHLPQ